jgi:hypothetical protein
MSSWGEDQDELMRYGLAPECCPSCKESISGMCKFHRSLEEQFERNDWDSKRMLADRERGREEQEREDERTCDEQE